MCFSNSILLVQVAKVYVSVFGDERGKEVAMAGLKAKAKYVRSQLGRRMKLRLTPEIRFIEDESFERGSRVRITILPLVFMVIYYMCLYNCNLQVCVVLFPHCSFPYNLSVTSLSRATLLIPSLSKYY
jgi:hypothetical protein